MLNGRNGVNGKQPRKKTTYYKATIFSGVYFRVYFLLLLPVLIGHAEKVLLLLPACLSQLM